MAGEIKDLGFVGGVTVAAPNDLTAASGTGDKNYITNPNASANLDGWVESTDGAVDVTRTTTGAELPREQTTASGLKIVGTASATNEYIHYRFTLDDADRTLGTKLQIKFAQKPVSGYATGDFDVEMYYNAQSDYLGAYTQVTVNDNDISAEERTAVYSFDTSSAMEFMELRIKATVATTVGVVISDVVVGPGRIVQGARSGAWQDYNETITGLGTVSNNNLEYRTEGENFWLRGSVQAGTTVASEFQMALPNSWTCATDSGTQAIDVGKYTRNFASAAGYGGRVLATDGDAFLNIGVDATATTNHITAANGNVISSSDIVSFHVGPVKITQLVGSGIVNFIGDEVAHSNDRMRATSNDGASHPSGSVFIYEDVEYDDGGNYNNSTGVFTCPADGKYHVTATVHLAGTVTYTLATVVRKNGTEVTGGRCLSDSSSNSVTPVIATTVNASKGDTIDIVSSYSGSTLNKGTRGFLQIERVADYTAGQAVGFGQATGGNYGLVDFDEFSASLDNDFSAGTIRGFKSNGFVTLAWTNSTFSSSSNPTSSALIPSDFRPLEEQENMVRSATAITSSAKASTGGVFSFVIRNWSGTATAATTVDSGGSMTYYVG